MFNGSIFFFKLASDGFIILPSTNKSPGIYKLSNFDDAGVITASFVPSNLV
jgi:hypothetical protein